MHNAEAMGGVDWLASLATTPVLCCQLSQLCLYIPNLFCAPLLLTLEVILEEDKVVP